MPYLALAFTSAPLARRACTTSRWPARIKAVPSSLVFAFTSAPLSSSACTTSRWPAEDACIKAVIPYLVFAFTSAPLARRALTIETSPFWAALIRSSASPAYELRHSKKINTQVKTKLGTFINLLLLAGGESLLSIRSYYWSLCHTNSGSITGL